MASPPGQTFDYNSTRPIKGFASLREGTIDLCYGGPITVTLTERPENGWLPNGWILSSPSRWPCKETGHEGGPPPTCTVAFGGSTYDIDVDEGRIGLEAVPVFCKPEQNCCPSSSRCA
jgi:hypothetical protein